MFFHKFSPDCIYVVMILASAKQSNIHVTNEYGELVDSCYVRTNKL